MFKITLTITNTAGLATLAADEELKALQAQKAKFEAWSLGNGLLGKTTTTPTTKKMVTVFEWESEQARDAMLVHFGDEYTDWYAAWETKAKSLGAKISKVEATV